MATINQIKEAIVALKDRTGSSIVAINKWLETEKKVSCFDGFRALFQLRGSVRISFFLQILRVGQI